MTTGRPVALARASAGCGRVRDDAGRSGVRARSRAVPAGHVPPRLRVCAQAVAGGGARLVGGGGQRGRQDGGGRYDGGQASEPQGK